MMKKNFGWIAIGILLVVLIFCASALYNKLGADYQMDQLATQAPPVEAEGTTPATEGTEPETMTAPDFTVVDGEGNEVKLSDFFGKPIVLNFWASWCGPCKREMPDFEEVYRELGDDVVFMIVNLTDGRYETMDSAQSFINSMGYTFPVYFDITEEAAYTYNIVSIPTTYFISARGNLIALAEGALDAASLEYGISLIYKEK